MIFFQPEKRIRREKVTDLVPSVIKNKGTPVLVKSFARISVFIKIGAVKMGQPERILGKMAGNPIQNDPDSPAVHMINKILKLFR
jgi:hypothetical protein